MNLFEYLRFRDSYVSLLRDLILERVKIDAGNHCNPNASASGRILFNESYLRVVESLNVFWWSGVEWGRK